MTTVTITVPATTANLGPGFDCMGMALSLRNEFHFHTTDQGLSFSVSGEGSDIIPASAENLVAKAMRFYTEHIGCGFPDGVHIEQINHVPAASGLGSSSTAVIAGLLGANALCGNQLSREEILALATTMEGHPDNVAPALFGGLVLVPMGVDGDRLHIEHIELPPLKVVIALPKFELLTADARAALPKMISRADAIYNMSRIPLVIRALEQADYDKLAIAMHDRIHQPYRMPLIPGMKEAFAAALESGAASVAISGAGPSTIAFAPADHEQIGAAMVEAYEAAGLPARSWVLEIDRQGSCVEKRALV